MAASARSMYPIHRILSRISAVMASHGLGPGAFVYVADSAMVTEKTLEAIGSNLFISRLPSTYAEYQKVVTQAVTSGTWVDIGKLAQIPTDPTRPLTVGQNLAGQVKDRRCLIIRVP